MTIVLPDDGWSMPSIPAVTVTQPAVLQLVGKDGWATGGYSDAAAAAAEFDEAREGAGGGAATAVLFSPLADAAWHPTNHTLVLTLKHTVAVTTGAGGAAGAGAGADAPTTGVVSSPRGRFSTPWLGHGTLPTERGKG